MEWVSMSEHETIAVLGGGNLGRALALGWHEQAGIPPETIAVTRRHADKLSDLGKRGFDVGPDNDEAVRGAQTVVIAVQPQQLGGLLDQIGGAIDPDVHRVISVVSGVNVAELRASLGERVPIARAMPNTAVEIGESMTCLAAEHESGPALDHAARLFGLLGQTLVIPEAMMTPATALCACGVAFFLRCIRAASQGGIEIGFHPEEALLLAAQTARGAASLLLAGNGHPEREIDRVTTPRGCTIAGLNEMEHQGLSSALIRGILVSAQRAEGLGLRETPTGRVS
jgi:pyrroline-5-carboxylate reductase